MARRTAPSPTTLDASMRVVILRGPDRYLLQQYTARLVEALEAEHGEIDRFDFEGDRVEVAQVLDELRSYGLLHTYKLVVVDRADQLLAAGGDGGPRRRTPRELLEKYAAEPVDSATLLLRAETWRPGRLDKVVAKTGAIIKCDVPDARRAVEFVVGRAQKAHGVEIDRAAATLLVDRIGPQLARLDSEIGKLAAYVGPNARIDADAVRTMVGLSREEQAWEIQSAMLSGTVATAVGKLRELIEVSRQPETLLMWAITDLLRKLHAAARSLRAGVPAAAIAKDLKLWGAARSTILSTAERTDPVVLAELLRDAIDADRKAKTGRASAPLVLELLAVRVATVVRTRSESASQKL